MNGYAELAATIMPEPGGIRRLRAPRGIGRRT